MKRAVLLVISSFLFGLLGCGVAFAAIYFDQGTGPADRPMLLLCALTGIGVATGFCIAAYGLRLDAQSPAESETVSKTDTVLAGS